MLRRGLRPNTRLVDTIRMKFMLVIYNDPTLYTALPQRQTVNA